METKVSTKATKATKIDWIEAQKYYLADPRVTYVDVANEFGVSLKRVKDIGAKEGWPGLRQDLAEKSVEAIEGEIVDENKRLNELHFKLAEGMIGLANEKLAIAHRQIAKAKKDAENSKGGLDSLTIYSEGMITEHRMKSLFESLVMGINLQRVTRNMPISVERKEITGREGKDFFGVESYDELVKLMDETMAALGDGKDRESGSTGVRGSKK